MKRPTWEYLTEPPEKLTDEHLNALGASGWELVTIHESRAIFKRVGPDFRERMTMEQRERLNATKGSSDEA